MWVCSEAVCSVTSKQVLAFLVPSTEKILILKPCPVAVCGGTCRTSISAPDGAAGNGRICRLNDYCPSSAGKSSRRYAFIKIWIDWRWLLRFPITKRSPPSVLLGPTQMDVLCQHRCNFRLCRILWNWTGSHPLVHRGGAVLAGTQAFSHCCVRFHKLDRQLYCGNGLPVCGGKLVNDWTWKKDTKICS